MSYSAAAATAAVPTTPECASGAAGQIDVLRLLTARSAEMMACEASLHLATASAVTPMQRLPVRLRRRAASHAVRRLPRRLHVQRHGATQSTAKDLLRKARQSRRYRRRPLRLAALALQRFVAPASGTTARRLPTHLWHAKRFHMIENWGWRMPFAPTDKIFKALQRATTDRCMLLDHGYFSCLLLSGASELLSRCLANVTLPFFVSSSGSGGPKSSSHPTGFFEVTGLFCREAKDCCCPTSMLNEVSRAILGPVRILRAPYTQTSPSRVWLWLHPSISEDAHRLLQSLDFVADGSLKVVDCTNHICRLKLVGPFSHQVLRDILQPPSEAETSNGGLGDWLLWRDLGNYAKAGLLPTGCTVGLICDKFTKNRPRLKLFNRNWLVPVPTEANNGEISSLDSRRLSWTELVNLQRDTSKASLAFNDHLAELLCPPQSNREPEAGIPLLLIQNSNPPLTSQKSQCVGWDIVLPRHVLTTTTKTEASTAVDVSSARDLLIACAYRGVRIGGLRDELRWATLTTEAAGRVHAFPYALWPDTPAARLITDKRTHLKVTRNKDGRLTGDAKRRASIKFRAAAPSSEEWLRLIDCASTASPHRQPSVVPTDDVAEELGIAEAEDICPSPSEPFFVLRDKALLVLVVRRIFSDDPRARHLTVDHLRRYDRLLPRALVMVQLDVSSRGIPEPKSGIYIPLSSDDTSRGPITYKENSEQKERKLIGYVDEGGYTFSHGHCLAIGFVCLAAACSRPKDERPPSGLQTVLFRAPRSQQFNIAKLTVLL